MAGRRTVTSCFCNVGCPNGTYPYFQFWVTAVATLPPDYGNLTKLFIFGEKLPGDVCVWHPVKREFSPGGTEDLIFRPIAVGGDFKGWQTELLLSTFIVNNRWFNDNIVALPESSPIEPEASNSCSRLRHELLGDPGQTTFGASVLIPAYPDACNDSDWPEKQQRPPLNPF